MVLNLPWHYFCRYKWVDAIIWYQNAGLVPSILPSPFRSCVHHRANTHTVHSHLREMFRAISISEICLSLDYGTKMKRTRARRSMLKSTIGGPHHPVYHHSKVCRTINPCTHLTLWSCFEAKKPVTQQLWSTFYTFLSWNCGNNEEQIHLKRPHRQRVPHCRNTLTVSLTFIPETLPPKVSSEPFQCEAIKTVSNQLVE